MRAPRPRQNLRPDGPTPPGRVGNLIRLAPYTTREWKTRSRAFLAAHPDCVLCARVNRKTRATVVDHIIAPKSDQVLFWNPANWQPLCAFHHSVTKQSWEDGRLEQPDKTGWPTDPDHPWNRAERA